MNESPATRCAALAETLADMARGELAPTRFGLAPERRRKAVAAYWRAQLLELGVVGQTVARATDAAAAAAETREEPA